MVLYKCTLDAFCFMKSIGQRQEYNHPSTHPAHRALVRERVTSDGESHIFGGAGLVLSGKGGWRYGTNDQNEKIRYNTLRDDLIWIGSIDVKKIRSVPPTFNFRRTSIN